MISFSVRPTCVHVCVLQRYLLEEYKTHAQDWLIDVLNGRPPQKPAVSSTVSSSSSSASSSSSGFPPASADLVSDPAPVAVSPSDPVRASADLVSDPAPVAVSLSDPVPASADLVPVSPVVPQPQILQLLERLEAAERKLAQWGSPKYPWSPATACCTHTPPSTPKRTRGLQPPVTPRKRHKADRNVIVID